jgi:hypothetical protein
MKLFSASVAILAFAALMLPAAARSAGSRDNPVPIGTSSDLDDNWDSGGEM